MGFSIFLVRQIWVLALAALFSASLALIHVMLTVVRSHIFRAMVTFLSSLPGSFAGSFSRNPVASSPSFKQSPGLPPAVRLAFPAGPVPAVTLCFQQIPPHPQHALSKRLADKTPATPQVAASRIRLVLDGWNPCALRTFPRRTGVLP